MGRAVDGVRVVRRARVLAGTARVDFRLVTAAAVAAGMAAAVAVAGVGIVPRARWVPRSESSPT